MRTGFYVLGLAVLAGLGLSPQAVFSQNIGPGIVTGTTQEDFTEWVENIQDSGDSFERVSGVYTGKFQGAAEAKQEYLDTKARFEQGKTNAAEVRKAYNKFNDARSEVNRVTQNLRGQAGEFVRRKQDLLDKINEELDEAHQGAQEAVQKKEQLDQQIREKESQLNQTRDRSARKQIESQLKDLRRFKKYAEQDHNKWTRREERLGRWKETAKGVNPTPPYLAQTPGNYPLSLEAGQEPPASDEGSQTSDQENQQTPGQPASDPSASEEQKSNDQTSNIQGDAMPLVDAEPLEGGPNDGFSKTPPLDLSNFGFGTGQALRDDSDTINFEALLPPDSMGVDSQGRTFYVVKGETLSQFDYQARALLKGMDQEFKNPTASNTAYEIMDLGNQLSRAQSDLTGIRRNLPKDSKWRPTAEIEKVKQLEAKLEDAQRRYKEASSKYDRYRDALERHVQQKGFRMIEDYVRETFKPKPRLEFEGHLGKWTNARNSEGMGSLFLSQSGASSGGASAADAE